MSTICIYGKSAPIFANHVETIPSIKSEAKLTRQSSGEVSQNSCSSENSCSVSSNGSYTIWWMVFEKSSVWRDYKYLKHLFNTPKM